VGFYGIEVDVAGEFKKIVVSIDEDGFVSSLKKVTAPVSFPVEVSGIGAADEMHDGAKVCVGRLPQQMIVIPHKDIGMEDESVPFLGLRQVFLEPVIILIAEENLLSFVPSAGNMIEGLFILDAQRTGHTGSPLFCSTNLIKQE
jgi:hypothetical protein